MSKIIIQKQSYCVVSQQSGNSSQLQRFLKIIIRVFPAEAWKKKKASLGCWRYSFIKYTQVLLLSNLKMKNLHLEGAMFAKVQNIIYCVIL